MLYVFGVGEVPISISGDPSMPKMLKHTTRSVGIVTKAILKLRSGDVLGVRGPFGSHWPVNEAVGNDVVIVAGGIGLAPLRPVLLFFYFTARKYGKIILFFYGTGTPEDLLYKKDWKTRVDVLTLMLRLLSISASGSWRGNVGVITTPIPKMQFDPLHTVSMICGRQGHDALHIEGTAKLRR